MRKLPIYLLVLFILAFCVSASSNWYTWGNQGFSTKSDSFIVNETFFFCYWGFCWNETLSGGAIGKDNVLFGSNLRAGSTDLTEFLEPITVSYPPVVLDIGNTGSNVIGVVSGKNLFIYSPELDLIGSFTHTNLLSNPVVLNYDGDIDSELIVCEGQDIMIYDMNDQEQIYLAQEWSGVCGDVAGTQFIYADGSLGVIGNHSLGQELFSVYRPDLSPMALRPVRTDVTNGTRHTGQSTAGGSINRCHSDFGNGFTVTDIDNDGHAEYIAITGGTPTRLTAVEIDSGSLKFEKQLLSGDTGNETCDLAIAQIGNSGGFKELLVQWYGKAGSNQSGVQIYDSTTSQIYSFGSTNTNVSFFSVADHDYDGSNEFMTFPNAENIFVFDQFVDTVVWGNISNSSFEDNQRIGYISMGEYNQEYTYQEVLTRKGIYEWQNVAGTNGEMHQIYEFNSNFDSVNSQVYPVSLQSSSSFNKDILVYQEDLIGTYLDSVTGAVCGNDLCESGENTLNCPIDCQAGIDALASGYCSQIEINPSVNASWLNGTRVQLKVTAQSEDNISLVRTRVFLYWQESTQWDSGWTNFSTSGTEFIHETFANYTTPYSEMVIYCQNTINQGDLGRTDFTYSVSLANGIQYGDSVYTYTDSTLTGAGDGQPDPSENVLKNAMDSLSNNQFGIGYLGIWLLFMLGLALFVLMLAGAFRWDIKVSMIGLILIEGLAMILGTVLGFIPIGVIIVIVVISIGIGALFLRRTSVGA